MQLLMQETPATQEWMEGVPEDDIVPNSHAKLESEREYDIKSIIDENETQYHIDWEDDDVTGEEFQPTWEPKEYANHLAVMDWRRRKALMKCQLAFLLLLSGANSRRWKTKQKERNESSMDYSNS